MKMNASNIMFAAFSKAAEENPILALTNSGNKDDLPEIPEEIPMLSEEDLQKAAEKARKNKKWAEQAGSLLSKLKKEKEKICSIEGWETEPSLVKQEKIISSRIKEIEETGDENLQGHVKFSEFLNFIRKVETPEQMEEMASRLVVDEVNDSGATRYHISNKAEVHRLKSAGKLSDSAFLLNGRWYLPYQPPAGEKKSSGQVAVEREVSKAKRRVSWCKKKKIIKKTDELKLISAENDIELMLDGVEGLYRLFADPIRDRKNDKKIIRYGGIGIVRLTNRGNDKKPFFVVEPVDGAGCFHYLSGARGWFVSLYPQAVFAKGLDKIPPKYAMDKVIELARELNRRLFPLWKDRKEAGVKMV
jgi:hypothetical protein